MMEEALPPPDRHLYRAFEVRQISLHLLEHHTAIERLACCPMESIRRDDVDPKADQGRLGGKGILVTHRVVSRGRKKTNEKKRVAG